MKALPQYYDNNDIKKSGSENDKMDGRKTAKKDEDIRNSKICTNVNTNTELGKLMKYEYHKKTGREILRFEKKGGNGDHFDILIIHPDGTFSRCEEKGTKKIP